MLANILLRSQNRYTALLLPLHLPPQTLELRTGCVILKAIMVDWVAIPIVHQVVAAESVLGVAVVGGLFDSGNIPARCSLGARITTQDTLIPLIES